MPKNWPMCWPYHFPPEREEDAVRSEEAERSIDSRRGGACCELGGVVRAWPMCWNYYWPVARNTAAARLLDATRELAADRELPVS